MSEHPGSDACMAIWTDRLRHFKADKRKGPPRIRAALLQFDQDRGSHHSGEAKDLYRHICPDILQDIIIPDPADRLG